MDEAQTERRASERGELKGLLIGLTKKVDEGFERGEKRFTGIDETIKGLKCSENTEIVKKINKWFERRERLKESIVNTMVKRVIPSVVGAGAFLASAIAYFRE